MIFISTLYQKPFRARARGSKCFPVKIAIQAPRINDLAMGWLQPYFVFCCVSGVVCIFVDPRLGLLFGLIQAKSMTYIHSVLVRQLQMVDFALIQPGLMGF